MHNFIKILIVLYSLVCVVWALLAIGAAHEVATQPGPNGAKPSAAGAEGACMLLGAGTTVVVWVVGMIPLAILWHCFKPKVLVEVEPRRAGSRMRRR